MKLCNTYKPKDKEIMKKNHPNGHLPVQSHFKKHQNKV